MANRQYTLRQLVTMIEQDTQCTCNLDKWQPEKTTGHTFVCQIHVKANILHKELRRKL